MYTVKLPRNLDPELDDDDNRRIRIHDYPVLLTLYNEAKKGRDLEWKWSAFWQKFWQLQFDPLLYVVTAEISPGGNLPRRRIDISVRRLEDGRLLPSFWFELKKVSGNVVDAENQAREAGNESRNEYGFEEMYVGTAFGPMFRAFTVDVTGALLPFDSGQVMVASKDDYYNIANRTAGEIAWDLVQKIKTDPPRPAQTDPSSYAPIGQTTSSYTRNTGAMYGGSNVASTSGHGVIYPNQPSSSDAARDSSKEEENLYDAEEDTPMESVPNNVMIVTVKRERHTFRPDEIFFIDTRGKKRRTDVSQWEEGQYNGKHGWVFQGSTTNYVCMNLG